MGKGTGFESQVTCVRFWRWKERTDSTNLPSDLHECHDMNVHACPHISYAQQRSNNFKNCILLWWWYMAIYYQPLFWIKYLILGILSWTWYIFSMVRFLEFPGQLELVLMTPQRTLTSVPQWLFSHWISSVLVAVSMFSPKGLSGSPFPAQHNL